MEEIVHTGVVAEADPEFHDGAPESLSAAHEKGRVSGLFG